MLLTGLAYTLLTAIRRLGLSGSELARAQVGTIRLKLLKIGAMIWRNTRHIRFCLSSECLDKDLLLAVAQRLTHRGRGASSLCLSAQWVTRRRSTAAALIAFCSFSKARTSI